MSIVSLYHLLQYQVLCLLTAHQCSFPGCNQVLILVLDLDGNMKIWCDVCAASEASFIQYRNLPGTIKTGCQFSPLRTSKYCFNHAPRVSKRSLHCDSDKGSMSSSTQYHDEEAIVKVILGKKRGIQRSIK